MSTIFSKNRELQCSHKIFTVRGYQILVLEEFGNHNHQEKCLLSFLPYSNTGRKAWKPLEHFGCSKYLTVNNFQYTLHSLICHKNAVKTWSEQPTFNKPGPAGGVTKRPTASAYRQKSPSPQYKGLMAAAQLQAVC